MDGTNVAPLLESASGKTKLCNAFVSNLTRSSALLILHKRVLEVGSNTDEMDEEDHKKATVMAIKSATRIVIDISQKFLLDLAFIDLPALPLPSTFCVYQAALLHIEFAGDEFLEQQWTSDMRSLQDALKHFARRWSIGSM